MIDFQARRAKVVVELEAPARDRARHCGSRVAGLGLDHSDAALIVSEMERLALFFGCCSNSAGGVAAEDLVGAEVDALFDDGVVRVDFAYTLV